MGLEKTHVRLYTRVAHGIIITVASSIFSDFHGAPSGARQLTRQVEETKNIDIFFYPIPWHGTEITVPCASLAFTQQKYVGPIGSL